MDGKSQLAITARHLLTLNPEARIHLETTLKAKQLDRG